MIDLHGDLLTDPANRPVWEQTSPDQAAVPANCFKTSPNGHSAIPIPGTHYALTTDEVYGTFTDPSFGCPSGARSAAGSSKTSERGPAERAAHPDLVHP